MAKSSADRQRQIKNKKARYHYEVLAKTGGDKPFRRHAPPNQAFDHSDGARRGEFPVGLEALAVDGIDVSMPVDAENPVDFLWDFRRDVFERACQTRHLLLAFLAISQPELAAFNGWTEDHTSYIQHAGTWIADNGHCGKDLGAACRGKREYSLGLQFAAHGHDR